MWTWRDAYADGRRDGQPSSEKRRNHSDVGIGIILWKIHGQSCQLFLLLCQCVHIMFNFSFKISILVQFKISRLVSGCNWLHSTYYPSGSSPHRARWTADSDPDSRSRVGRSAGMVKIRNACGGDFRFGCQDVREGCVCPAHM
jgi:hypothetical protein